MESTGSYGQPVYKLLEGALAVWVVNAQHMQSVPGRKTDVKDATDIRGRSGRAILSWRPSQADVERLCTLPGGKQKTAKRSWAESGTAMSQFPTAKHLAAWTDLCPGHHESAGKQDSGNTRNGSVAWQRGLVEAALAAGRARNTSFGARYQRLQLRRGSQRAAVAVAHTLLVIADHPLSEQTTDREWGSNYRNQQDRDRVSRQLKRRLERLAYQVSLEPTEPKTPTSSMP